MIGYWILRLILNPGFAV